MNRAARRFVCIILIVWACALIRPAASLSDDFPDWNLRPVGDFAARWRGNWTPVYENWDPRRHRVGDSHFEFDRARLGLAANGGQRFAAEIAIRAESETSTEFTGERRLPSDPDDPAVRVFVDSAWLRVTWPDFLVTTAGLVPTGWISFVNEKFHRRFIEKSAYELWLYRRAPLLKGLVATDDASEIRRIAVPDGRPDDSDVGVTIRGASLQGFVGYQAGFYSVDTLRESERKPGLAVDSRVTIAPFANVNRLDGLSISGYAWAEEIDADKGETVLRLSSLAHYRIERANGRRVGVGFEAHNQFYTPRDDATAKEKIHASLFSMWCDVDVARRTAFIGRYDHFDPNRKNGTQSSGYKDERSMFLLGMAYDFSDEFSAAFDMRVVSHRAELFNDDGKTRIPKPEMLPYFQVGMSF